MGLQKYIVLIFGGLLAGSCGHQETDRLEQALRLSGNNRAELEKVLAHYAGDPKDSLKLKAAVFLIGNMPGHWGPDSSSIAGYKAKIDSTAGISPEERDILLELPVRHPELCPALKKTEDLHVLTAEKLIGHIDEKFSLKEKSPWLEDLDFDTFCEYLLPYRIGNEWTGFSHDTLPSSLVNTLAYITENYHNCRHSLHSMASYILRYYAFRTRIATRDPLLAKMLLNQECRDKMSLIRYRRMGIPVALDYNPARQPDEENYSWIVPLDSRLTAKSLPPAGTPSGKIYRHTFSANPKPATDSNEYVPSFFRNPFLKDVTALYLHTADVNLPLETPGKLQYAYLAMYDGKEWQPVAYGKKEKNRYTFRKLGKNCVYLPVYYPDGKMQPLAPPFILRSTGIPQPLDGSRDSVITLQADRLCPYTSKGIYYKTNLQNVRFTCAGNENFKNPDTACTITEVPHYRLYSIRPAKNLTKRFWRVEIPRGYCVFSELQFLDTAGRQLKGRYLIPDTTGFCKWTDNNPLTYKTIRKDQTIDFGKPVKISEIRYMNQSDGYNIWPGEEYELLYYQEGAWHTAEKKRAENQTITFGNVPAGCLYQLRNITHEKNGTVFTWEKNRTRFW